MRWGKIEHPADCVRVLLRERAWARSEGDMFRVQALQMAISVVRQHLPFEQRSNNRRTDQEDDAEATKGAPTRSMPPPRAERTD